MQWPGPIIEARFLKRYKRFFADFELADGTVVTAHCANTGSMKTCLAEGARAWITYQDDPKRKLRYSFQAIQLDDGWVGVHTGLANALVRELLERKAVPELADYSRIQSEQRYGQNSRIDLLLEAVHLPPCYLEVKNVTLLTQPGEVGFPDAVTTRGTKHLHELVERIHAGDRAALFYCVQRESAQKVVSGEAFDPEYARTLHWAISQGLQILAWRAELTLSGVSLVTPLPMEIQWETPPRQAHP